MILASILQVQTLIPWCNINLNVFFLLSKMQWSLRMMVSAVSTPRVECSDPYRFLSIITIKKNNINQMLNFLFHLIKHKVDFEGPSNAGVWLTCLKSFLGGRSSCSPCISFALPSVVKYKCYFSYAWGLDSYSCFKSWCLISNWRN